MPISGFQDYWQVGCRLMFQRDPIAGVVQPTIDLGTLLNVTPQFTVDKIKLIDSDGGTQKTVAESVTKIDETYEIQCANFNNDNLELLFLSGPAEDFVQSATTKKVTHYGHFGKGLKIHDDDASKTWLYALASIAGIYQGTVFTRAITAINAATKTITLGTSATIGDGDKIIVSPEGLANVANAGTYTVVGAVSGTSVVVAETFAANEAAITGELIYADTGTVFPRGARSADPLNWDVVSLDRGFIQLPNNTPFATGNVVVVFKTGTLSEKRLIKPQSEGDAIQGTAAIYFGRESNQRQHVRECRVSLSPSATNFQAADFANFTLTASVLSELTEDNAGRLLAFKGDMPEPS